jgi:hypothetical protein
MSMRTKTYYIARTSAKPEAVPVTHADGTPGTSFVPPCKKGVLTAAKSDGHTFTSLGRITMHIGEAVNGSMGVVSTHITSCIYRGTLVTCPHKNCHFSHNKMGTVMSCLKAHGYEPKSLGILRPDLAEKHSDLFAWTEEQRTKRRKIDKGVLDIARAADQLIQDEEDELLAGRREMERLANRKRQRMADDAAILAANINIDGSRAPRQRVVGPDAPPAVVEDEAPPAVAAHVPNDEPEPIPAAVEAEDGQAEAEDGQAVENIDIIGEEEQIEALAEQERLANLVA